MDFSQNLGKAASCSTQQCFLPCFQIDAQPMPWCSPAEQATPGDSSQPEATIHFCPCGPHIFTLPSCPSSSFPFVPSPPYRGAPPLVYCVVSSHAFPSSGSDNSVLPAPDFATYSLSSSFSDHSLSRPHSS